MHRTHCILVQLSFPKEKCGKNEIRELREDAVATALSETEHYGGGRVFDYRQEDTHKWSDGFLGVVLGLVRSKTLLEQLTYWKEMPLAAVKEHLRNAVYTKIAWRPVAELQPGMVTIETPGGADLAGDQEKQNYLSGYPIEESMQSSEFLCRCWAEREVGTCCSAAHHLARALQLVLGDYLFDSQFFSCPDGCSRLSTYTEDRVQAHPEQFALVFLDYHN